MCGADRPSAIADRGHQVERIDMEMLPLSYPFHAMVDPLAACVAGMTVLIFGSSTPPRRRRKRSPPVAIGRSAMVAASAEAGLRLSV